MPFFAGIPVRTGYVGELRHWLLNDARRLDEERLPQMAQRYAALGLPRGEALKPPLPAPRPAGGRGGAARAMLARLGLDRGRPAAALCPGAEYGPAKRWPARYFAELAQGLAARGCAVWLIGSQNDAAGRRRDRAGRRRASAATCAARPRWPRRSTCSPRARWWSATTPGLMHVAAALGRPLIALYGSSSPAFTPPLSPSAPHPQARPALQPVLPARVPARATSTA